MVEDTEEVSAPVLVEVLMIKLRCTKHKIGYNRIMNKDICRYDIQTETSDIHKNETGRK